MNKQTYLYEFVPKLMWHHQNTQFSHTLRGPKDTASDFIQFCLHISAIILFHLVSILFYAKNLETWAI